MKHILLLITLVTNLNQVCFTQEYTHPLDIELLLSGTFGELRSNHFHAGIDLKTKGVEGQNVYSIADGYISRIKISSWGYGKVVYINHYDGRTSVYAHLRDFASKIDSIITEEQYKSKKFEINYYPKKNEIKVKQKEFIGKSGNSGSSGGAHLHFEIRDAKTQNPINPLFFNFKINDTIAPVIKKIKLYHFNENYKNSIKSGNKIIKEEIKFVQKNNLSKEKETIEYYINDTIIVNKNFSVGISTYDKSNNAYNKNGVYSIKLFLDSTLYYHFQADTLDFNTTRFINAHIDYKEKKRNNIKFHKCFILPNNPLKNYKKIINNGIINLKDIDIHLVTIKVEDIFQNSSTITFNIQRLPIKLNKNPEKIDGISKEFLFKEKNTFTQKNIRIYMPKFSLYKNMVFQYKTKDSIHGIYGNIHQCHNNETPIHKKYTLYLKEKVPEKIKEKAYIAVQNKKGGFKYIGGKWEGEYLKTKTREFGNFCIVSDTINPKIKAINIYPGKKLTTQQDIKFTIEDNESGIKEYQAEINGEWILMNYDHKKKLIKYKLNNSLNIGKHKIKLLVTDNVGNTSQYEVFFTL